MITDHILASNSLGASWYREGEMAEWSNAVALKAIEVQASGGSNPSLSAIYIIHVYDL